MKTRYFIKKTMGLSKGIILSILLIQAIVICGSTKKSQAQQDRQAIYELSKQIEIHNGVECYYIVVTEPEMTLEKIAQKFSIELKTLNEFNKNLRGQNINMGLKVYYPVERLQQPPLEIINGTVYGSFGDPISPNAIGILQQANQTNNRDDAKYRFAIIRGDRYYEWQNVNQSNLALEKGEYALRLIDEPIIQIPQDLRIMRDGDLQPITGEVLRQVYTVKHGQQQTKAFIVLENNPLLRYNSGIEKHKGSYNVILLDSDSVGEHGIIFSYPVSPAIQLNFYSDYSKFKPVPFKIDSVNVYREIKITEDLNIKNPLQLKIKTPLAEQEFSIRKQPILKIEGLPDNKAGYGPQSVNFRVKLLAYTDSLPVRVNLSTTHGIISPHSLYLKNGEQAAVKLKSFASGTATISAEALSQSNIKKDSKKIKFDITKTNIQLSEPRGLNYRVGYQYYNVDVSLPQYNGIDSVLVCLSSDFGELSDDSLYLEKDKSKTIYLKSNRQGEANLIATSRGFDKDEKQMIFTDGPPRIVFSPKDFVIIDAFGLEKKEVTVSLKDYIGKDSIMVNLSIAKAHITPSQIRLSTRNSFSQKVTIESKWVGKTTLKASSNNRGIGPSELSVKFQFPFLFIVFIFLGGSIGALVKNYMKPQKLKLITSLIYGCLTGLAVTIMVLFLGLKIPFINLADDANIISGVIVFGLSLIGSIFWEPIHSSLSNYISKTKNSSKTKQQ